MQIAGARKSGGSRVEPAAVENQHGELHESSDRYGRTFAHLVRIGGKAQYAGAFRWCIGFGVADRLCGWDTSTLGRVVGGCLTYRAGCTWP